MSLIAFSGEKPNLRQQQICISKHHSPKHVFVSNLPSLPIRIYSISPPQEIKLDIKVMSGAVNYLMRSGSGATFILSYMDQAVQRCAVL